MQHINTGFIIIMIVNDFVVVVIKMQKKTVTTESVVCVCMCMDGSVGKWL